MTYDRERGTYAFENAFRLKKARLNMDETPALAMATKMLGTLGETFERAFESLEKKVLDVSFPCRELLPSSALVLACADRGERTEVSRLLKAMTKSCVDHSPVRISCRSLHSGEETRRDVEPYYLFFSPDGFRDLGAFCRLGDGRREVKRLRPERRWNLFFGNTKDRVAVPYVALPQSAARRGANNQFVLAEGSRSMWRVEPCTVESGM